MTLRKQLVTMKQKNRRVKGSSPGGQVARYFLWSALGVGSAWGGVAAAESAAADELSTFDQAFSGQQVSFVDPQNYLPAAEQQLGSPTFTVPDFAPSASAAPEDLLSQHLTLEVAGLGTVNAELPNPQPSSAFDYGQVFSPTAPSERLSQANVFASAEGKPFPATFPQESDSQQDVEKNGLNALSEDSFLGSEIYAAAPRKLIGKSDFPMTNNSVPRVSKALKFQNLEPFHTSPSVRNSLIDGDVGGIVKGHVNPSLSAANPLLNIDYIAKSDAANSYFKGGEMGAKKRYSLISAPYLWENADGEISLNQPRVGFTFVDVLGSAEAAEAAEAAEPNPLFASTGSAEVEEIDKKIRSINDEIREMNSNIFSPKFWSPNKRGKFWEMKGRIIKLESRKRELQRSGGGG